MKLLNWIFRPNDELYWAIAEALLWIEEEPSAGAIPAGIKDQDERTKKRLYADSKYLCKFVANKLKHKCTRSNWRLNHSVDANGEPTWVLGELVGTGVGGSYFRTAHIYKNEEEAYAAFEHVRWR